MYIWSAEVSRSIYEGKWLAIKYENQSGEETSFWCAIRDINPISKLMEVDVYNLIKVPAFSTDYKIYFNKIKHATVLESSFYEKQVKLIEKIKTNIQDFLFLELTAFEDKILNYYLDCYNHDNEPFQTEYTMLEGIDVETFDGEAPLVLEENEYNAAINILQNQLRLKIKSNTIYERIVLNYLSVYSPQKGLIPIVFFNVSIDIKNKLLIKDIDFEFSSKAVVFSEDNKVILQDYTEVDYDYFKLTFAEKEAEYTESIKANLAYNEKLDQRPYFMKMATRYSISVKDEYQSIANKFKEERLTQGLISFFGKQTEETNRTGRPIIVESRNINTNQLRTIFNTLNKNVVFVQGPPGTGKTVSIVNIIHSCLFNNQTVLLCSNNNEAVDNVLNRLSKAKHDGKYIKYPYLRLGSDLHIMESLDRIAEHYAYFSELSKKDKPEKGIREIKTALKENMKSVSELIKDFEFKLETESKLEILNSLVNMVREDERLNEGQKASQIIDLEAQIQFYTKALPKVDIDERALHTLVFDEELVREYLHYEAYEKGMHLISPKNKSLVDIIQMPSKKERIKEFKTFIKTDDGFDILLNCFPIIASTNISVLKIGNPNKTFDLLVMEEASQCSSAVALVPMNRCQRACFIGDPNQLQPIVNVSEEKNNMLMNVFKVPEPYNYRAYSILNSLLKIDSVSKFILLKKHYRSAKKIINFANKKYYNEQLEIETPESTQEPLKLINVENSASYKKNTSMSEVNAIIKELKQTDLTQDIAIITPFRNQVHLIRDQLEKEGITGVKVDTVYGFQGQEKDKIIFSSAITEMTSPGTFDWLKNNKELINVMSTRSKKELVVISDVDRIKALSGSEMNDMFEFLTYMELNGNSDVVYQGNSIFDSRVAGYKSYNSDSEAEFLRTIAQLKSTTQKFTFGIKPKVSDILDLLKIRAEHKDLFRYGVSAHFDFVLFDYMKRPLLVVEICGEEHLNEPSVLANDLKKVLICIKHNLKIVPIFNSDVRRYNEVKKIIMKTLRS